MEYKHYLKISDIKFNYRKMHHWQDAHVYEVFSGDWSRIRAKDIVYMNLTEFKQFYRYMSKNGEPPKLFTPA